MYVGATYVHLRHDAVENEAVYIIISIRLDGCKEVMNCTIARTESKTIWNSSSQILRR
ncbi:transposase [Levilactobacillus brevis]|uniref:transposase n=1 Tax=Levilactobacillus brevis TaxID=1580 RepID=UPI00117B3136